MGTRCSDVRYGRVSRSIQQFHWRRIHNYSRWGNSFFIPSIRHSFSRDRETNSDVESRRRLWLESKLMFVYFSNNPSSLVGRSSQTRFYRCIWIRFISDVRGQSRARILSWSTQRSVSYFFFFFQWTSFWCLWNIMNCIFTRFLKFRYGRKPIIYISLLCIAITGALSALAPSFLFLVIVRFIQGFFLNVRVFRFIFISTGKKQPLQSLCSMWPFCSDFYLFFGVSFQSVATVNFVHCMESVAECRRYISACAFGESFSSHIKLWK